MNKYIIMGYISGIGGGELYTSNKVSYLNEKGWDVSVYGYTDKNIYFENLQQFKGNSLPYMAYCPFLFKKSTVNSVVERFIENIDLDENEKPNLIIETGSVAFSMWGEIIAEKLGAKNFVFLLDPYFHNIGKTESDFFWFKYRRGELACTTKERTKSLLSFNREVVETDYPFLKACCTNSVKDIRSECVDEIRNLPKVDFSIGNCGRIDKPYVKEFIEICCEFAKGHRETQIRIIMIGADVNKQDYINSFNSFISENANLSIFYTGSLFPIPSSIFNGLDVCVGSSGSAKVIPSEIVPTVLVKDDDIFPVGVVGYDNFDSWEKTEYKTDKTLLQIFEDIHSKLYTEKKYSFSSNNIMDIETEFDKHMTFIAASDSGKQYFPINRLKCTKRQRVLKVLLCVFGLNTTNIILKIRTQIRLRRKNGK